MREYRDFDIIIEEEGDGSYRARVIDSPAGQALHDFVLPFEKLELENFLLRVGRTRSGTRRLESPEMGAARTFGSRLYDAVFGGDVETSWRRSLDDVEREGKGLRLRLRLGDTPELANLPWEYLFPADADRFLVLSAWTPIVRYIDLPTGVAPLTVAPPLRILVMISNPSDVPELDVEAEWQRLASSVEDLQDSGRIELVRLDNATLLELQRELRRGEFHIFHFIGHGGFDEAAGDGLLVMEDDRGRGREVTGRDLGTILHDHRSLRFAVLNACEGARASMTDPFAGVAQSLVRQGVPAVVAMQFEITDAAAITFAHELYAALADGLPVDAAVAESRRAIFGLGNDVEWGTPVLYMRTPDGTIFDFDPAALAALPVVPPADERREEPIADLPAPSASEPAPESPRDRDEEPGSAPRDWDDTDYELAATRIDRYLNDKRFDMMSLEGVRRFIDADYDDGFIREVIRRNPTLLRTTLLQGDEPGVGRILPPPETPPPRSDQQEATHGVPRRDVIAVAPRSPTVTRLTDMWRRAPGALKVGLMVFAGSALVVLLLALVSGNRDDPLTTTVPPTAADDGTVATTDAATSIAPTTADPGTAGPPITSVTSSERIWAERFAQRPTIDGDLTDWGGRQAVLVDQSIFVHPEVRSGSIARAGSTNSGHVFVGWDDEALYVAAEVVDDSHFQTRSDDQVWQGDGVTLNVHFGDPVSAPERAAANDFQITLSPGDPARGTSPQSAIFKGTGSGFVSAATDQAAIIAAFGESGYRIEASIPFTALEGIDSATLEGLMIGGVAMIFDNDGENAGLLQTEIVSNVPGATVQSPSTWGTVIVVGVG